MDGLDDETRKAFLDALDIVYRRSKAESRAGFPHLIKPKEDENESEE